MHWTNTRRGKMDATFVLVLYLSGCNAISGILEGSPAGLDFCVDKPSGTPLSEQEHGDCQVVVCGTNGRPKVIAASEDDDDGNPCTQDACINGKPVHTALIESIPCYTGPLGTENLGICRGGMQMCVNGQAVGECIGEQLPQPERCAPMLPRLDEDCDSLLDEDGEGCTCGDGIVQANLGEECEDGNTDSTDACTAACLVARCGDGFVFIGDEACDDGNLEDGDTCHADCTTPVCGDGVLEGGEGCDDGNTLDGDACPGNCQQIIAHIAVGADHSCALFVDGRIKCWGTNEAGQLGLGDTSARGDEAGEMGYRLPVVDLGTNAIAVAIAAGYMHTCALLATGSIKCWGYGGRGALGLGNRQNLGDEPDEMGNDLPVVQLGTNGQGKPLKALALAAGGFHTCALLEQGSVKCWGFNGAGQLGLGDTVSRGDVPKQMGDDLPAVALGSGKSATTIAAGKYHTCAVLNDGMVKCWGYNLYGQLGLGDVIPRGDSSGQMGDNLPAVDLGTGKTATYLATGHKHTCVFRNDGKLVCWGAGNRGQIGSGKDDNRGDELGEMGDQLISVNVGLGVTIQLISAGGDHTCARIDGQGSKCWGANDSGQLGLEDTFDRGTAPWELGENLQMLNLGTNAILKEVAAGRAHTCAILSKSTVKCWGTNDHGQLGLANLSTLPGSVPDSMGDFLPPVPLW